MSIIWSATCVLRSEALYSSGASFRSLDLAVVGFGMGYECIEQLAGYMGGFGDGAVESGLVGLGWLVIAGKLAHELQGGIVDFFISGRRVKIE